MIKIVILGYPHSGTTILKSILGHIDEIHEIYKELPDITTEMFNEAQNQNKKYILIKVPRLTKENVKKYLDDNFIVICIIRNPLYAISSIKKRLGNDSSIKATNNYIKSANTFVRNTNSEKNIYTIKYEDIFKNDYESLKKILNKIGFNYENNI